MVLPAKVLLLVYALPVAMSFFLHLALHHNVLFEHTLTRTAGDRPPRPIHHPPHTHTHSYI